MLEKVKSYLESEAIHSHVKGKILLADENARDLDSYSVMLRNLGYQVSAFDSYSDAALELGSRDFDMVVVSQGGPSFKSRCVLERASKHDSPIPVLVLADPVEMPVYLEAMELGAVDYLEKHPKPSELGRVVKANLRRAKALTKQFGPEPISTKLATKAVSTAMILMLSATILEPTIRAESVPSRAGSKTIANLQAAYESERNAYARYLAFADTADKEGFQQVAILFRAAALSEHVHLTRHAALIRKMGGEPKARAADPMTKSTRENLETSIDHAQAVLGSLIYPKFVQDANSEGNEDTARSFEFARHSEAQHVQLFVSAVFGLDQRQVVSCIYHVCLVCGSITDTMQSGTCKTCSGRLAQVKDVS